MLGFPIYTVFLRVEAIGFPTFGLLLIGLWCGLQVLGLWEFSVWVSDLGVQGVVGCGFRFCGSSVCVCVCVGVQADVVSVEFPSPNP